jgi:hypothetical protein
MKIKDILKSTDFEQYIELFAEKGYYTIEEIQALQNTPDKYIQVLNEIEPDDIKMMSLFAFLKNASDNLKIEKEVQESMVKKNKEKDLTFLLIVVIIAGILLVLFQSHNDGKLSDVTVEGEQYNKSISKEKLKEVKVNLDTDEDGVFDEFDVCIYEYGPLENNGCPWPDSDYSGVSEGETGVSDKDEVKYLMNSYYSAVSDYYDYDAWDFFSPSIDRFISKRNITPDDLNKIHSESHEFLNPEVVILDLPELSRTANGVNYWSYWVDYSCYRKSKDKIQNCKVNIEVGFDKDYKIKSYRELEITDLTFEKSGL